MRDSHLRLAASVAFSLTDVVNLATQIRIAYMDQANIRRRHLRETPTTR